MTKSAFYAEFKGCGGVKLPGGYILFRKPVELWNMDTGESRLFRTVEDAMSASIGSETVGEYIARATMDELFKHEYD